MRDLQKRPTKETYKETYKRHYAESEQRSGLKRDLQRDKRALQNRPIRDTEQEASSVAVNSMHPDEKPPPAYLFRR
jgi:hypothetical protein